MWNLFSTAAALLMIIPALAGAARWAAEATGEAAICHQLATTAVLRDAAVAYVIANHAALGVAVGATGSLEPDALIAAGALPASWRDAGPYDTRHAVRVHNNGRGYDLLTLTHGGNRLDERRLRAAVSCAAQGLAYVDADSPGEIVTASRGARVERARFASGAAPVEAGRLMFLDHVGAGQVVAPYLHRYAVPGTDANRMFTAIDMNANDIDGARVMNADTLNAGQVNADDVNAGQVNADRVNANRVDTGTLTSGSLTTGEGTVTDALSVGGGATVGGLLSGASAQFSGDVYATNYWHLSDRREKTAIADIRCRPADELRRLLPKEYRWRRTGERKVSYIAQDVQAILPDFVRTDPHGRLVVRQGELNLYLIRCLLQPALERQAAPSVAPPGPVPEGIVPEGMAPEGMAARVPLPRAPLPQACPAATLEISGARAAGAAAPPLAGLHRGGRGAGVRDRRVGFGACRRHVAVLPAALGGLPRWPARLQLSSGGSIDRQPSGGSPAVGQAGPVVRCQDTRPLACGLAGEVTGPRLGAVGMVKTGRFKTGMIKIGMFAIGIVRFAAVSIVAVVGTAGLVTPAAAEWSGSPYAGRHDHHLRDRPSQGADVALRGRDVAIAPQGACWLARTAAPGGGALAGGPAGARSQFIPFNTPAEFDSYRANSAEGRAARACAFNTTVELCGASVGQTGHRALGTVVGPFSYTDGAISASVTLRAERQGRHDDHGWSIAATAGSCEPPAADCAPGGDAGGDPAGNPAGYLGGECPPPTPDPPGCADPGYASANPAECGPGDPHCPAGFALHLLLDLGARLLRRVGWGRARQPAHHGRLRAPGPCPGPGVGAGVPGVARPARPRPEHRSRCLSRALGHRVLRLLRQSRWRRVDGAVGRTAEVLRPRPRHRPVVLEPPMTRAWDAV